MAAFNARELTVLAALAETFVRGNGPGRARLAADALEDVVDPAQLTDLHLVLRAMDFAGREPAPGRPSGVVHGHEP